MSRAVQDQFIDDDEEETCPLCVEEFDIMDQGFKPCPCGYQICQFCYNNVKNNMNGLCPACRRTYNNDDIEYKPPSLEEQAAHKARQAQKQKKTQAALQKEKQKAEADNLSRKHLAGLRVVQKNLVYVTGLSPNLQEEQLLQTLRGNQYFGQYGKIIKIVVSKAKDTAHQQSVGVYVTYERKEDAATCISLVNGSKNGERTLRAQFGTTKYCSAYLRGENCTNRNCMFLHEPGEANESYSRADLSALNAGQHSPGRAPPPQSQQPVASASQPMARQGSGDRAQSPSIDRPALPSTASWASRPPHMIPSRTESRSTSGTVDSPAPTHSTPAPSASEPSPAQERAVLATGETAPETPAQIAPKPQQSRRRREASPLSMLLKGFNVDNLKFTFSPECVSQSDLEIIENYPPLFDQNGGAKNRLRRKREEEQRQMEREAQAIQQPPSADIEDNLEMSGSLQLGGEPEERQSMSQPQSAIQPPGADGLLDQRFQFGGISSPTGDRGLTPQRQQQLLMQSMKGPNQGSYLNNFNQPTAFQQPSNPPGHQRNTSRFSFANDSTASTSVKPVANAKLLNQQSSIMPPTNNNHFGAQHQQQSGNQFYTSNVQGPPPGLKATGTPPVSGGMTFGQGHGFATGGLQYGSANAPGRNANEEMMRNLLRRDTNPQDPNQAKREFNPFPNYNNSSTATFPAGPPSYASLSSFSGEEKQRKKKGKKHRHANTSSSSGAGLLDLQSASDPSLLQARFTGQQGGFGGQATASGLYSDDTDFPPLGPPSQQKSLPHDDADHPTPPVPPGFESQATSESRHSTPTIPPGLNRPTAVPDLQGLGQLSSRPASRATLKRTTSQIQPALPLRPATPAKHGTPKVETLKLEVKDVAIETPTKAPKSTGGAKKVADVAVQAKASTEEEPAPSLSSPQDGAQDVQWPNLEPTGDVVGAPKRKMTVPKPMQPAKGLASVQMGDAKAEPVAPEKPEPRKVETSKRQPPGKLDIAAAVKREDTIAVAASPPTDPNLSAKGQRSVSQTPSATSKPESPSVSSPAVKTAPRTLRVIPTPKTETPPTPSIPTPKEPAPAPSSAKLPSPQPSVASINLPGTPSSEHVSISDNVSVTSTSQSRANSPPPPPEGSKGSTATVKPKTKTQLKKERQERAKAHQEEKSKTDEVPPKPEPDDEPAQEAIVSRKKKARKEKEPNKPKGKAPVAVGPATGDSTPTASRPASPQLKPEPEVFVVPEKSFKETKVSKPSTPVAAAAPAAPTPPMRSPAELSPPPTPTLTAAQLLAELKATAPEIQKCIDSLFRTPAANHHRPAQNISAKDLANPTSWKQDFKLNLTKDEVDALLQGAVPAVKYGGEEGRVWDRGMVTPTGAHLRALTQELELRFLELEKAIRNLPEELRFRPSKPQNELKFPSLDLETLKRELENSTRRDVNVMEQMIQDGSNVKKGAFLVDEASRYLNEFVMPPATPPPSAGGGRGQGHAGAGAGVGGQPGGGGGVETAATAAQNVGIEIAERQWSESKRVSDERDQALRKMIKRNKKVLGLG